MDGVLPKPREWNDALPRWLLTAVPGGFFLVAAATAAADGRSPWLRLALAVFCLSGLSLYLPDRSPGVVSRGGALAFLPSRWSAVMTVGMLLFLGGVSSMLEWPWNAVLFASAVALFAWTAWRGRGAQVTLRPRGLVVGTGRNGVRLAWDEAARVRFPRPGRLRVPVEGGERTVYLDFLVADQVAFYWTVRHYATHPEHREELADERAADRVRRADLSDAAVTSIPAPG